MQGSTEALIEVVGRRLLAPGIASEMTGERNGTESLTRRPLIFNTAMPLRSALPLATVHTF